MLGKVSVCWLEELLTFEKGVDDVLSFSAGEAMAIALSLFSVIIGIELSSDALRASDGCNDPGFPLPGPGVIDRETHLSRPLLDGVGAKNAADEELNSVGPAD